VLKLNPGVHNITSANQPADAQTRIEKLFKTLEDVRKQLRELYKRLDSAGPEERMQIRHQITELEALRDTVQQQIVNLTEMEKQRKHNHAALSSSDSPQESAPDECGQAPSGPDTSES
jgi:septal ring factor EnvC (AmiA/AmiB activator)